MKGFVFAAVTVVVFLGLVNSVSAFTECWMYDGNYSGCSAHSDDCFWSSSATDPWCPWKNIGDQPPNLVQPISNENDLGCCLMFDCWFWEGNQSGCESAEAQAMNCFWVPNDQNQNPWCPNPVGCCDKLGCWNGDANLSACSAINDTLGGICKWHSDGWCGGTEGCCDPLGCIEAGNNQSLCNTLADMFMMPCNWTGTTCEDAGMAFFGGMDDCLDAGGDWDGTSCNFPEFEGFVHCWFADNQPDVCGNITGCIYCGNTNASTAYDNSTGLVNASVTNESSFCYGKQLGWCEGHQVDINVNDAGNVPLEFTDGLLANDSITCEDIQLKTTCNFGPVPFCKWNDSAATYGLNCTQGFLTEEEKESLKPKIDGITVKFCDDPVVDNETKCNKLKTEFFMPCKWDNKSTTSTADDECVFDWESVAFGDSKGELDFYDIQDEETCIMAGGKWVTEKVCGTGSNATNYGAIETKSWCEPNTGTYSETCNDACWACENATACNASTLGYCWWDPDKGCREPEEFAYEGGDCYDNCEFCNYYKNKTKAAEMCTQSPAGCKWETDPYTNESYCISNKKSGCDDDCFSCWDPGSCNMSTANCTWDENNFCRPTGYTSDQEICFNMQDDDSDTLIDCEDPECATDQFCGGFMMGDCWSKTTEIECNNTPSPVPGLNCTWAKDPWSDSYHCDMPGWNCWMFDNNATACNATPGCIYHNMSSEGKVFCDVNKTLAQKCFNIGPEDNASCITNATQSCVWVPDPMGYGPGWCEFAPFAECHNLTTQEACNNESDNYYCIWHEDWGGGPGGEGGFCEPACFNESIQSVSECINIGGGGLCEARDGFCEPQHFMGGCPEYDGNKSACEEHNGSCVWFPEINANNNVTGTCATDCGYCDPKTHHDVWGDVVGEVVTLITDPHDASPNSVDIESVGMRDFGKHLGFGIGMEDMNLTVFCNGYYIPSTGDVGSGTDETKVYIYIDSDEVTTGGCSAPYMKIGGDTVSKTGFEFMIEYIGGYEDGDISESQVFYRCEPSSQTWVLTNIPLYTDKPKACGEFMGIGLAVEKEDLKSFPEYDKTKTLRIFVTSANSTGTRGNPTDYTDVGYFTPGTIDFKFECCECPEGTDMDGDGLSAENDPDCAKFKKFGYVPSEDCFSPEDDDEDGMTNCADPDCYYAPECEGQQTYDPSTDTAAPLITWFKVERFDKGAFIKYDSDKPANGTVLFYYNDSNCTGDNATGNDRLIYDIGIIDTYMKEFKKWHDGPVDNMVFNPQRLGYNLTNGTTYYFKIKLCGLNNLCSLSACMNFTTAKSTDFADCPKCNPVVAFDFMPPPGVASTDPLGDVQFAFKWPGAEDFEVQPDFCGVQKPWNELTEVDWQMTNPNSTDPWKIELGNATLATLDDSDKNINGTDLLYVEETTGDYVGMKKEAWEKLEKTAPATITIQFPKPSGGTCDELWKCAETVTSCVEVTDEAINHTTNTSGGVTYCEWTIPGDLGFSVYGPADASSDDGNGETPGGGGPGGGAPTATVSETVNIGSIAAGSTGIATFEKEDTLGIQEIRITAKDALGNVSVTVKKETSKPADVTTPSGIVYRYFTITATNVNDENLTSVTVKFKVNKTWFTDNNVNQDSVKLNRFKDNAWNALPTSRVAGSVSVTGMAAGGDCGFLGLGCVWEAIVNFFGGITGFLTATSADYIYYEATSPGFSVFAVTGETVAQVCTPGAKQCSDNNLQQCKTDGSGWETIETCTYGCDSVNLVCNAEPVVGPVCTSGTKRCLGNNLQQCNADGSAWVTVETCTYGCDSIALRCRTAEESPVAVDYLWIVVVIVIVIIIVAGVLFLRRRRSAL